MNYCEFLEQSIQGKKHGFLAGNLSYYVGGFHASWKPIEDETIGLTHPFHHDLRSRGVGLLESGLKGTEHTGTGNDYMGWEFYKDTRVLYGSVGQGTWSRLLVIRRGVALACHELSHAPGAAHAAQGGHLPRDEVVVMDEVEDRETHQLRLVIAEQRAGRGGGVHELHTA